MPEPIDRLVDRFLADGYSRGLSPVTVTFYRSVLGRYLRAGYGPRRDDIRKFLAELRGRGCTPQTLLTYYRPLHRFFWWCFRERHLPTFVMSGMEPPRVPQNPKRVPDDRQVRLLLKTASLRDRAIFLLAIEGGLRRREIWGLSVQDLDLPGMAVWVRGKGNRIRRVELDATTVATLRQYLKHRQNSPSERLFVTVSGKPLTLAGFDQIMRRARERLGIPVHYHLLRHYAATRDAERGMDPWQLRERLGHRSVTTTERYVHRAALRTRIGHGDRLLSMEEGL
jgi:integrase